MGEGEIILHVKDGRVTSRFEAPELNGHDLAELHINLKVMQTECFRRYLTTLRRDDDGHLE